jgi:hypothetical protein
MITVSSLSMTETDYLDERIFTHPEIYSFIGPVRIIAHEQLEFNH